LNALVAIGLVKKQDDIFRNTDFTAEFLVKNSPAYLGGLGLSNQTWNTWSTLSEAVGKGTTIAMNAPINDRAEEWRDSFIRAMHFRAGQQAIEIASVLDLGTARRILDVGGGSGAFAFGMIRRNPAITATIFDLPNITPITSRYVQSSGLAGKVQVVNGDYLVDDLGNGFDLVFMSAIIHINSPDENRLLIRKGAEALNPGGQLVIVDHIMNEDRTEPAVGAFFALNMLVGTQRGDTYTEKEISCWMQDAGLIAISMKEMPSGIQLMTGKRPDPL
jgi:SAM-dependent methyltransferase